MHLALSLNAEGQESETGQLDDWGEEPPWSSASGCGKSKSTSHGALKLPRTTGTESSRYGAARTLFDYHRWVLPLHLVPYGRTTSTYSYMLSVHGFARTSATTAYRHKVLTGRGQYARPG